MCEHWKLQSFVEVPEFPLLAILNNHVMTNKYDA